jgi:2-hydroxy-3-oxopropionate reductase
VTIEAVAEALLLAERSGVDPARVREALMGGFATSKVLEVHGRRMIDRTFAPGFRIRLHRKDLSLAIDSARALDVSLPATAATQQVMNGAVGAGLGDLDHSALRRAIDPQDGAGS